MLTPDFSVSLNFLYGFFLGGREGGLCQESRLAMWRILNKSLSAWPSFKFGERQREREEGGGEMSGQLTHQHKNGSAGAGSVHVRDLRASDPCIVFLSLEGFVGQVTCQS